MGPETKKTNKQTDTIAVMLYSIKRETAYETPKEKSTNKKKKL